MVDKLIFIIVIILMGIGVLASYSLPLFLEVQKGLDQFHFVIRDLIYSVVAVILIVFISRLNPEKWFKRLVFLLFGGSLILMIVMVIFPSIAPPINGARRWISLGFLKFAPVELFKVGFIGFLALNLPNKTLFNKKRHKSVKDEFSIFLPYFVILMVIGGSIVYFQSDFGQVMVMTLIFILMWLFIGANLKLFGILVTITLTGAVFVLINISYRLSRLNAWLYSVWPSLFNQNEKYHLIDSYRQIYMAMDAIHSGGIIGNGMGNGVLKLGFFSDVYTDFVLAGLAEEGGFLLLLLIIVLMFFLVYRILKIANHLDNVRYALFCIGVAIMISVQFVINSFGEVGLLPMKGLTVPFVSYGGSSLISMSIAIGMVLMLSKKSDL